MLATPATLAIAVLLPCLLVAVPLPWRRGSRQPDRRLAWLQRLRQRMRPHALAARPAARAHPPAAAPSRAETPTP
ncbi:hypothetical protein [Rhodanobacter sp. PCA2]|uniref:hypothetical protein n=1 Tax=Rhodanobacter sp. PCA2 TaxID=2006117 RepID=UPI0015E70829|nr:hypothetical protein [Rhodanobacter sp. PCA2]MBA2079263.1 hypothetical protein [Rhodanobacter sp. PCA2]